MSRKYVWLFFGNLGLSLSIPTGLASGAVTYSVTDIGVPDGFTDTTTSVGDVLNDNGQVLANSSVVVDPGDCAANRPPLSLRVPVRYTPGVGLERLDAGATENTVLAAGMNASGQVFGWAVQLQFEFGMSCFGQTTQVSSRVWRYTDGVGVVNLPVPSTISSHFVFANHVGQLNDSGDCVIQASDPQGTTPVTGGGRVHAGVWQDFSSLDPRLTSTATIVQQTNNLGQLCGNVASPTGFMFRYTDGVGLEIIPEIGNPLSSSIRGMSQAGDLVGVTTVGSDPNYRWHAWIKRSGQPAQDIHNDAVAPRSDGQLINNTYAAGSLYTASGSFSGVFRWDAASGMVKIPLDPFLIFAAAEAMNNKGVVVGYLKTDIDPTNPWVWSPANGVTYLRDAIGDPYEEQWDLLDAVAINGKGQIVVLAVDMATQTDHVLLLTPQGVCAADFDQNNVRNVSDIFAFLRSWFSHQSAADIDGNGTVNVSDIFAFLRAWFAGC